MEISMLFQWLRSLTKQRSRISHCPRPRFRPRVEPLEDRRLLAGQLIAFTAGLDFPEVFGTGEERGGIYVVRPDGTGLRQITAFQTSNFTFSGDGLNM